MFLMLSWVLQVEDVYFPKERATGRRRPFCFVTFASQKVFFISCSAQHVQQLSSHCDAVLSLYIRCLLCSKLRCILHVYTFPVAVHFGPVFMLHVFLLSSSEMLMFVIMPSVCYRFWFWFCVNLFPTECGAYPPSSLFRVITA